MLISHIAHLLYSERTRLHSYVVGDEDHFSALRVLRCLQSALPGQHADLVLAGEPLRLAKLTVFAQHELVEGKQTCDHITVQYSTAQDK